LRIDLATALFGYRGYTADHACALRQHVKSVHCRRGFAAVCLRREHLQIVVAGSSLSVSFSAPNTTSRCLHVDHLRRARTFLAIAQKRTRGSDLHPLLLAAFSTMQRNSSEPPRLNCPPARHYVRQVCTSCDRSHPAGSRWPARNRLFKSGIWMNWVPSRSCPSPRPCRHANLERPAFWNRHVQLVECTIPLAPQPSCRATRILKVRPRGQRLVAGAGGDRQYHNPRPIAAVDLCSQVRSATLILIRLRTTGPRVWAPPYIAPSAAFPPRTGKAMHGGAQLFDRCVELRSG